MRSVDECSDVDSPLPMNLVTLNRLSMNGRESFLISNDVRTNSPNVMGYMNNSTSNGGSGNIVARGSKPTPMKYTPQQRAELLAAKSASVEHKKRLLDLLKEHRDEIEKRVNHDGVDINDPTSSVRIARRHQQLAPAQ
jgi:hypothetical protein